MYLLLVNTSHYILKKIINTVVMCFSSEIYKGVLGIY